jgi:hypothetical protein
MNTNQTTQKEKFADSDKKIPRDLIISYQGKPYITKAGLEWKANYLFGGAGYSLKLTPYTLDYSESRFIFEAHLTVLRNGTEYTNYGETTLKNTGPMMKDQLLHLAATRAECRVLRMATACGYASYDEVATVDQRAKFTLENGDEDATEGQKKTIKALGGELKEGATRQDASDTINQLSKAK